MALSVGGLFRDYTCCNSHVALSSDYHAEHWSDKKTYFSRDIKFSKPIQSALLRGTCVVTQVQRACVVFAGYVSFLLASLFLRLSNYLILQEVVTFWGKHDGWRAKGRLLHGEVYV